MTESHGGPLAGQRRGIDPRGPRFVAWITAVLLIIGVFLALLDAPTDSAGTVADRASEPGFLLLGVIGVLFAWGFVSPATAPWAVLFRSLVQPRLTPAQDLEDPRPPRFAQSVGFAVVAIGLVLHLMGVPWALVSAAAAAFIAAFLNAAFGFCLGCQIYLGLTRVGLFRPGATT